MRVVQSAAREPNTFSSPTSNQTTIFERQRITKGAATSLSTQTDCRQRIEGWERHVPAHEKERTRISSRTPLVDPPRIRTTAGSRYRLRGVRPTEYSAPRNHAAEDNARRSCPCISKRSGDSQYFTTFGRDGHRPRSVHRSPQDVDDCPVQSDR